MAIISNVGVMLAKQKMRVTELAEKVGITLANISIPKNGKANAIRLSTLEAICRALEQARTLVLLLSRHATAAAWVTFEQHAVGFRDSLPRCGTRSSP